MPQGRRKGLTRRVVSLLIALVCGASGLRAEKAPESRPSESNPDRPISVVSRDVELEYRLTGIGDAQSSHHHSPATQTSEQASAHDTSHSGKSPGSASQPASDIPCVELWYTRDRGATWQCFGPDGDGKSPYVFHAPAEGLYGLSLLVRGSQEKSIGPARFEPPQRWVMIDSTPPLLQWDGVDRDEDFGRTRTLHLRWTAYDDHFGARPISILYQVGDRGEWRYVERETAGVGRYDWVCPADISGSITLKLQARDVAGNQTQRTAGPYVVMPAGAPATRPAVTSKPSAVVAASRPAETLVSDETLQTRRQSERLYQQGTDNLRRGEYAVAAERLREAMEANPGHLAACSDLAGIYYMQRDYGKALELYESVLKQDANHAAALRGAALVYVARKQYAPSRQALQKLVTLNSRDAESWLDLGDVLFMMGSPREARSNWDRAATVDPAAAAIVEKARRRLESYGGGAESVASPSAGSVGP